MNTHESQTLFTYNNWANQRMLAAVKSLETSDFARDLQTSYRSVQGTLVHILWAEWLWLQRWQGESPKRVFASGEFPDAGAIEAAWANLERDRQAFMNSLTDERLKTRIAYENLRGQRYEYSLAHMMQHLVNHSTYHRGQIVTLLRQLGQTPPATDFLVFLDEARS